MNCCFSRKKLLKCSIPLSMRSSCDKLVWLFKNNGLYSTRSAYHLLRSEREGKMTGSSCRSFNGLWKKIWKVPIQNMFKNFIWRIGRNILPTGGNLVKKCMPLDNFCLFCKSCPKSIHHLFLRSNFARAVWVVSPLGHRVLGSMDFLLWLDKGLDVEDV